MGAHEKCGLLTRETSYGYRPVRSSEQAIPAVREEFETLLRDLVQIPTVSMDPAHASDINRVRTGRRDPPGCGATVEVVETPGNPVVFGQFTVNPAYPTVAIYNHLDVQPANEPQWQQDPFVFQRDGERYLGRGTTDDKGQPDSPAGARFAVQHNVAQRPVSLGTGRGNWQSALRGLRGTATPGSHLQFGPRVRHCLVVPHHSGRSLWPTRDADHAAPSGDGAQRLSFRLDRRRRA